LQFAGEGGIVGKVALGTGSAAGQIERKEVEDSSCVLCAASHTQVEQSIRKKPNGTCQLAHHAGWIAE